MMIQVNVQEAKATLSKLLVQAERGEDVVVARRGTPVVRLTPIFQSGERDFDFLPGKTSDEVLRPIAADELEAWG
ncbi:MAG: type II toxin-antitoxin system prevent-host-death family antitoxin [Bifidobacteriaceae bacterium]|jgi:prevent-host-death family protein|nr:type II toxin-antitoxin system prevent-host-death family antitoxin [Bifidobacteriaceae bacterium]